MCLPYSCPQELTCITFNLKVICVWPCRLKVVDVAVECARKVLLVTFVSTGELLVSMRDRNSIKMSLYEFSNADKGSLKTVLVDLVSTNRST